MASNQNEKIFTYAALVELVNQIKGADSAVKTELLNKLSTANADLTELKKLVGSLSDTSANDTVVGEIHKLIESLDATVGEAAVAEGKHVAVQVVEADGVITAVNVAENDIASAALLGTKEDAKTAETAFGYIANEADRATTAEQNILNKIGEVPTEVGQTTTDTVIKYVDAKDTALDQKIAALNALHANAENGGKQTVANEVATGIASLVADAPEAFNTLKEIAEWISSSDGNADGFNAAKRITDLEAAVGEGGSVQTQITNAVQALDATVFDKLNAEGMALAAGEKVGVKVIETDGQLTSIKVFTNDIASAALLGLVGDTADKETAFGKIAAAKAEAKADFNTNAAAISALEALVGDTSVQAQITNAINDLDATVEDATGSSLVNVSVTQANGVLTSVTVTDKREFVSEAEVRALFTANAEQA